jgi:hypothetical protein
MARTQIQGDWIATISALDALDNPITLHYSDKGYKDPVSGLYYDSRMTQPARIRIGANDGGLLKVMNPPSTGEIILANKDGRLNGLLDYSFDGREVALQLVAPDGQVTTWLKGITTRFYQDGTDMKLTLKSLSESLDLPLNQARYSGGGGVEGLTTDIMGNVKPRVYGSPPNVTPVLCYAALGIYQVSDLTTTTVTAVYDKGVAITLGVTRASLAALIATSPTAGTFDRFQGYFRLGTMTVQQITCDANDTVSDAGDVFEQVCSSITFSTPRDVVGEIPVLTDAPTHKYQLSASATCVITSVYDNGTRLEFEGFYADLAAYNATAPSAGKWKSYQGKIRISPKIDTQYPYAEIPLGTITCNATDSAVVLTDTYTATVNALAISRLNACGAIGLYLNSEVTIRSVLDQICKSCGAYWWFGDSENVEVYNTNQLNAQIYQEPSATPDLTLYPYRTEGSTIARTSTGIGENGLPIYSVVANYRKNWTVQTDVLLATPQARKAIIAVDSLVQESADLAGTKARHPQSTRLTFESLLNSQTDAQAVTVRLLNFLKKRCDVVELEYIYSELPRTWLGMTVKLYYPRFSYNDGVSFILVSSEVDVLLKTVKMRLMGYKV